MSHLVSQMGLDFITKKPYSPPSWASHLNPIPSHSYSLSHLPTPIHKWNLPNLPKNTEVWLKREDLSGMQLSGNKARKLEFLLADAVAQGADCVITLGGIQSNHCRSTAVAARYLNLDSYLILFTSEAFVDQDPGLTGNLLVERLVGAHVELILETEFANIGSVALMNHLKEKLIREGRRPYVIATGGSDSLGTCGGTVAGLSLGSWMSSLNAKVHAFSIYYEPDYLYEIVQGLIDSLEADVASRDIVNIQDAKGLGYAISTSEELKLVKDIAEATGVVLDPVYSGKAAYGLLKDMSENPKKWEGRKILFVHTGGLLGWYGKIEQMGPLVGNWRRMDLP
ncbi:putative D-cysteine desulfhydrase 1, mitochondrial isoform X2 [Cannabis sativa]|uniref:putative D-cysteine desulfhydrase 1, mitochondrial isoform X2 n=1 Tax=Cannabis sativa TaxID=3483 RepID=UPI0029C9EE90|nr:putative D-cysteine desulfhydrase 1, mitochondrial isoform X2 [Cannabis sativa]